MTNIPDPTAIPPPTLEAELLQLWRQFLNRSDITIDDDFFESGGDSLLATELLVEAERLTRQTIPPSILFETGTVRQLVDRLGRPTGLKPEIAVRMGGSEGRLLHFFHGDFRWGGISFKTVAEKLPPNQPILAIAPHGSGDEQVPASIQQMAAERLPVVRKAQPHGPYLLGGQCNGAAVAFEVARLLVAAGERTDLVVMVDPPILSIRPFVRLFLATLERIQRVAGVAPDVRQVWQVRTWRWLGEAEIWSRLYSLRAAHFWKKAWPEKWAAARQYIKSLRYVAPPSQPSSNSPNAGADRAFELKHAYNRAMAAYRPAPLEVPVLYFSLLYDGRPWRRISSQTEFFDQPGPHLLGSNIDAVMRLRARLDALRSPEAIPRTSEFQRASSSSG